MKQLELSNLEIADLCREMALLLHAGIGLGDGLALLAEQETNLRFREILTQMAEDVDLGAFWPRLLKKAAASLPSLRALSMWARPRAGWKRH